MSPRQDKYDQFKDINLDNMSEKSPWLAPRLSKYDILGSTAEQSDNVDADTPDGLATIAPS